MDERPATRADLEELLSDLEARLNAGLAEVRTELKTEMAGLGTELKSEMTGLKTELAALKTEMRADFATKAELAAMEQRLTDAVREQLRASRTEILNAFLSCQETPNVQFCLLDEKTLHLNPPAA